MARFYNSGECFPTRDNNYNIRTRCFITHIWLVMHLQSMPEKLTKIHNNKFLKPKFSSESIPVHNTKTNHICDINIKNKSYQPRKYTKKNRIRYIPRVHDSVRSCRS